MKSSLDYRIIGAGIILTFLFFLIGAASWEMGVLSILALAAFWGFRIVLEMKQNASNRSVKIVCSRRSPDGIVTAEIEEVIIKDTSPLMETSGHYYFCWVKRTYQDGVYIQEEELDSRDEAESWLEDIYRQELEKHLQKISVGD